MSNIIALNNYLQLFQPFFDQGGVTEICINRPYELWLEQNGQFKRFEVPQFSLDFLHQFACLVGEYNNREISSEYPSLSSILPDGSRIQFVMEPACEKGSFICAIRRKAVMNMPLEAYFSKNRSLNGKAPSQEEQLLKSYYQGTYPEFLKLAVRYKKNILISGGTSTGKTTLLNVLLETIPRDERIITIETDREVVSVHPNSVHLLASEEGRGLAELRMHDLLKASLRLRPDRILVSELRAEEAFPYLRAINSGHPGSISTLHADNPKSCFEQLAFMAMQSGSNLSRQELIHYAKAIINVIVQIKRDPQGERRISEIYFDAAEQLAVSPAGENFSPVVMEQERTYLPFVN